MPADAELARTGLRFNNAFAASCMCTPSRATLFTGRYPAEHGLTLTLTTGGARPRLGDLPPVVRGSRARLRRGRVPRRRAVRALSRLVAAAVRQPPQHPEPELSPTTPNLARMLAGAGYHVGYKGKWHLTKAHKGEWSPSDAERIAERYGFRDWEPPDAGENVEPSHFGGGYAGRSGEGWDEDFTRQAESFLARLDLPEPFALVVSLINPHDVLGYPSSYAQGGYRLSDFRGLGVRLPATVDESLFNKPRAHTLMGQGQTAFLGPLRGERERLDYVNFYAHLHRFVDAKIARILDALGDAGDPGSLRARTIVVRTSDHGEMGLAHGGLRQKMFNAYEETINVPLVVSNPVLFAEPRETEALASLVDLMPTLAAVAGAATDGLGLRGTDLTPVIGAAARPDHELLERVPVELDSLARHPAPRGSVQDSIIFTYDDHKAASALSDVVPAPNRIRCLRERRWKHAVYVDPRGRAAPEYELYDLESDPEEERNLVARDSGTALSRAHRDEAERVGSRLAEHARERAGLTGIPSRMSQR